MDRKTQQTSADPRGIIGRVARIREAANAMIEKELVRRGIAGIVPAHGGVLQFLFRQAGPVPIKALVEHSGRVKSTITGIVNTLERNGYLTKQECEEDARSIMIALTDKGWALKKDFQEISELVLGKVYGEMPEGDRQRLVDLLAQVEANLQK